jgi:hypothetical protein
MYTVHYFPELFNFHGSILRNGPAHRPPLEVPAPAKTASIKILRSSSISQLSGGSVEADG